MTRTQHISSFSRFGMEDAVPLLKQTKSAKRKSFVRNKSSFVFHDTSTSLWTSYISWTMVLFPTVPVGLLVGWLGYSEACIFILNFLAIIPLSTLLGNSTEVICSYTNDVIGGLLNATFGNAVEVILGISALRFGLLDVVKATLLGSVLSNLLFVLGWSFLLGGFCHTVQPINPAISDSNISVLAVALFGFTIPAVFSATETEPSRTNVQLLSLLTAIFMFLLYLLFLIFELITHAHLYDTKKLVRSSSRFSSEEGGHNYFPTVGSIHSTSKSPLWVAIGVQLGTVVLTSYCSEYLVQSIQGFSKETHLSSSFVAFVLLPIVGNAAEHLAACTFAIKGNIDLSISIACGSSVQVALFVAPLLVISSWFMPGPVLTLDFHLFETVMLGIAVAVTSLALRDNSSNWLEGAELLISYCIISTAFFLK